MTNGKKFACSFVMCQIDKLEKFGSVEMNLFYSWSDSRFARESKEIELEAEKIYAINTARKTS